MPGEVLNVDDVGAFPDGAITFSRLDDQMGLEIRDTVERRRYRLLTPATPWFEPVEAAAFRAPVDAAVRLTTDRLRIPYREVVHVHDHEGTPVTHAFDTERSCPPGRYVLSLTASVKLYLRVEAPVTVTPRSDSMAIDFGEPTEVLVGARSPHRQPSGTITTTPDLDDFRAAVSALPSALKTTSPERSFPTLRGHPPLLELGDQLDVPPHLDPPDTGITVEIERSYADVYAAAPLAFYLGADILWGDRRISTEAGTEHELASRVDFEVGVARALKQSFLLDCLTRTEGLYPVDLDERRRFESSSTHDLNFAALYEAPPAERLDAYLDVPWAHIEPLVPTWSETAYVDPRPDSAPYLPFLLDTLSTVRTSGPRCLEEAVGGSNRRADPAVGFTRSSTVDPTGPSARHLVLPHDETSLTKTWVGDGVPLGGSKAIDHGYRNRLKREPVDDDIRLVVVCNEPDMRDERDSVEAVYTDREDRPLDVTIRTGVSNDELRRLLEQDAEFFHFIGHVDHEGFRCEDGWLDAGDLEDVGADAFLLNSCRSYEQGERLIEKGSVAGIVTLADLPNHRAVAIGRTMAQFLNAGFPFYAAMDVVRDSYQFGSAYALLGDGHLVLTQPMTTFLEYFNLIRRTGSELVLNHRTFLSRWDRLGTEICPLYSSDDRHYLHGGEIATLCLSEDELMALLALQMPLRDGGDLRFSIPDMEN